MNDEEIESFLYLNCLSLYHYPARFGKPFKKNRKTFDIISKITIDTIHFLCYHDPIKKKT